MTRIPLTLAALAAVAAAAPAAAQYGQYNSRYDSYAAGDVDIDGLRAQIDAGVSRGAISSRDAWSLRSQLSGLVNLQRQYAQNGLTRSEREDLDQRALGLRNEIAQAGGYASGYGRIDNRYDNGRYDNGRYDDRYANDRRYDDRSGQYGGYGSGYNAYNDGTGGYGRGTYDNRAYGNAYGNNSYADRGYGSGRDSRYDRDRTTRDDGRYDRDDDDGYGDDDGPELRAGDRAPAGLYGVPDEYRARFRDGPNFYYRYGAGNVYQIDARNGLVTRVIRVDR